MQLRWEETTETGEVIIRDSLGVTVDNAHTYAKENCRQCYGRGVEHWDNGWNYYMRDINEEFGPTVINKILDRKPKNPRIITCDCVLRTLQRVGETPHQLIDPLKGY